MLFAALWNGLGTVLLGVAVLFIAFLMHRSGLRKSKNRPENLAEGVRGDDGDQLAAERSAKRELERYELRMHELRREFDALAQTRIAVLNALLAQAEDRIAELDERLQQLQRLHEERNDNDAQAA